MGNPLRIQAVVVCDEVRREESGKAFVIGAYVGDILLPQFPSQLNLAFYIIGTGEDHGPGEMDFKFQHSLSNGESPAATAKLRLSGAEVGRTNAVVFPPIPFGFDQPTELEICVLENGSWRVIDRKRVALQGQPAASSSAPT